MDATADIKLAARRIVFGKYLNCGQTCVAPDYILCEKSVRGELVNAIKSEIVRQFGEAPLADPDYGRIVNQKHLALYIFSKDRAHITAVTWRLPYGGGCVNDVVIHLATSAMPFGGVGESGMGSYHCVRGFEAFSHRKSMVDKKTWIDLPMRYQPYQRKIYGPLLRLFLR